MKKLSLSIVMTFCIMSISFAQDETFDTLTANVGDQKYVEFNNTTSSGYRLINDNNSYGVGSLYFQYNSGFSGPIGDPSYSTIMTMRGFNFGVGTAYPLTKFHVNGISYFQDAVGIGTSSPSVRLEVVRDENPAVKIKSSNNGRWVDLGIANCSGCWSGMATDGDVVMRAKPGSNDLVIANQGTGNLILGNGDTGSEVERLIIDNTGKVGIGTTTPGAELDVNGDAFVDNLGISTTSPQDRLQIGNAFAFHDGGNEVIGFGFAAGTNNDLDSSKFSAEIRLNPGDGKLSFGTSSSITSNPISRITILNNGNVGIGTPIPTAKLTVNGKILAEEVQVVAQVPPDYVFQKYYTGHSTLKDDYEMLSIEDVEAYTKANHHLPEVPSAEDLQENGMNVSEMTQLLLQKIEELTLYTIEQEKRIKQLEASQMDKK